MLACCRILGRSWPCPGLCDISPTQWGTRLRLSWDNGTNDHQKNCLICAAALSNQSCSTSDGNKGMVMSLAIAKHLS
jgi:hypothetical protein